MILNKHFNELEGSQKATFNWAHQFHIPVCIYHLYEVGKCYGAWI